MPVNKEELTGRIRDAAGRPVPIIAFYSVQGGVGKTTLSRKFAELVTAAGRGGNNRPNVLLVDFDIDSQGLTFRLADEHRPNLKTVHDMIAERNVVGAQAINVTGAVSLTGGISPDRGELYLVPAAPPQAKGLYDNIAKISPGELLELLQGMIQDLVVPYRISCVVIDCAPGAQPHTAAAAAIADVPLLIGRNEDATYAQISSLPERFREWFDEFQPPRQRVIINAVSVKEYYDKRAKQYAVFDYIPMVSDVIHETEGLSRPDSLRMLLFEKYVVDIIQEVLKGRDDLVPQAPEVLGQEWVEVLVKLEHCEEAPRMRRLRALRHLRWLGGVLILLGLSLAGAYWFMEDLPEPLKNAGVTTAVIGGIAAIGGFYFEGRRQRVLAAARRFIIEGTDGIFRKLKAGASHRRELEEMRKLAETVPYPR